MTSDQARWIGPESPQKPSIEGVGKIFRARWKLGFREKLEEDELNEELSSLRINVQLVSLGIFGEQVVKKLCLTGEKKTVTIFVPVCEQDTLSVRELRIRSALEELARDFPPLARVVHRG
jgi:hypothetical protein